MSHLRDYIHPKKGQERACINSLADGVERLSTRLSKAGDIAEYILANDKIDQKTKRHLRQLLRLSQPPY